MVDWTIKELDAAAARGARPKGEPRAVAARFDRDASRIVVDLDDGASFAFPPRLVQGLQTAVENDLGDIEILGDGYGLHWRRLDVDYTVAGLAAGLFGTAAYLAGRAGRARSDAKAAAARVNGAGGGRPRKTAG